MMLVRSSGAAVLDTGLGLLFADCGDTGMLETCVLEHADSTITRMKRMSFWACFKMPPPHHYIIGVSRFMVKENSDKSKQRVLELPLFLAEKRRFELLHAFRRLLP